ncbi:MAG: membrane protein insertase YidC [Thermodesulfobacteriaceae bacterium]
MERNVILAIVLSILVIIIFQVLQMVFFPPPQTPQNGTANLTQPQETMKTREALQERSVPSQTPFSTNETVLPLKKISLITPLYEANLNTSGGRFTEFKLLNYRKEKNKPDPVSLVPHNFYPFEIYLASDPSIAYLTMEYQGPEEKTLNRGESERIVLTGEKEGLSITKVFTFKGDNYFVDLSVELKNLKNEPVKDRLLIRGLFSPFVKGSEYVFKGPFYYTNHLNEVELKDTLTEYVGPLKYLGYMDVYFMTAIIPEQQENFRATFRRLENSEEFILWTPEFTLNPGEKITYNFKLYLGPKKSEEMKKEYPLLSKALYFGFFDIIAKPLLWLLKFLHNFTNNYGWAIVIVTIFLRILFYPLNHISFKSMKKLQELQPVIQRLKEKYKDDPQTLQKEIINLYKTHKINPFSGCLPILIQIPVFFAFYKVLLMAIELRHAPFILWIDDLSAPERLYLGSFEIPWLGGIPLLTILMGATMFIQQKLTPSSMDPVQEKVMLILPILFTILFVTFPSGLVLYWFVNNLLSLGQQILTLRMYKK